MTTPTSIPFSQIPGSLEVPGTYLEFNAANANNGTAAASYRFLILGQMRSAGTATPLVPVRITGGKAQADLLFGQGSMLSNMVAAAVVANDQVELWALPVLDNAAGTSATGTIAAQDQMGLAIGSASPGDASWSGWVKEIQSAKADNDLAFSPAKASGWQSAADALSAFATGIGAKFEPSGTDVASDKAAASNTQSGSNFGKIALWTVGGLAAAGLVWWGISAMNKD